MRTDRLPLHDEGRAFASGGVSDDYGGAVLASPAAADLDRDGSPEIVVADLEGKVVAWDAGGQRVFSEESNLDYSGKPLQPFADVRRGKRYRTQHGFLGSPVIGDLDGDGRQEIVAASMDRHLYAWKANGSLGGRLPGADGRPVEDRRDRPADPRAHLQRQRRLGAQSGRAS